MKNASYVLRNICAIIFLLPVIFALTHCSSMFAPTTFVIDHDQANVSFTRTASTAQLDTIRQLMGQQGADLVYTSIKKDGDKLSELSFTLSYGGHTGSAKTNFVNLRGRSFGFIVEFRDSWSVKNKLLQLTESVY